MPEEKKYKDNTNGLQLTEKQIKFVEKYLDNGGNATQAYLYSHPGVQYKTASSYGFEYLESPAIQDYLAIRREELKAKYRIDREKMIRELTDTAEEAKRNGKYREYATLKDMVIKMAGLYEPIKYESTTYDIKLTIPGVTPSTAINVGQHPPRIEEPESD